MGCANRRPGKCVGHGPDRLASAAFASDDDGLVLAVPDHAAVRILSDREHVRLQQLVEERGGGVEERGRGGQSPYAGSVKQVNEGQQYARSGRVTVVSWLAYCLITSRP